MLSLLFFLLCFFFTRRFFSHAFFFVFSPRHNASGYRFCDRFYVCDLLAQCSPPSLCFSLYKIFCENGIDMMEWKNGKYPEYKHGACIWSWKRFAQLYTLNRDMVLFRIPKGLWSPWGYSDGIEIGDLTPWTAMRHTGRCPERCSGINILSQGKQWFHSINVTLYEVVTAQLAHRLIWFTDIRDREWLSVCFDLQSNLLNVTNLDNQKLLKFLIV